MTIPLQTALHSLLDVVQVVYDDVRNHGRSERRDALGWKLELCADDLRAFRDTRSETIDGTHRPRHA